MTYVEYWPAELHPLVPDPNDPSGAALVPDTSRVFDAHQLRPDLIQEFLAWSGGEVAGTVNGGPVVLLPGGCLGPDRLLGLGDFAVRGPGDEHPHAEAAAGFWQRYTPRAESGTTNGAA